jgi:hypothetical protein
MIPHHLSGSHVIAVGHSAFLGRPVFFSISMEWQKAAAVQWPFGGEGEGRLCDLRAVRDRGIEFGLGWTAMS